MPVPAFQPNAFQFDAFQTQRRIPCIVDPACDSTVQIEVVMPVQRHAAGNEVYIRVYVRDSFQVSELLFNPVDGVTITIRGPDGVEIAVDEPMTNESVGQYSYRHQTETSDAKGGYTGEFIADNDGSITQTLPMLIFVLE